MSETPESPKPYQQPPIVGRIRTSRRWHSKLSVFMAILLLISAVTGLLLGWKKQSDWLQPGTQKGQKGELADWKPISELSDAAVVAFRQNAGPDADYEVDRMDVRPGKNVVKVRFEHDDYEVQVDGITGKVLSVGNRNADWIERIHDGSIVSDLFKLISMNVLSIGVFIMAITGLWLYFGPKRYRAQRRANE
ncbi:MAG: PepSY domain-containing protein [Saprospiraceae bacterium]